MQPKFVELKQNLSPITLAPEILSSCYHSVIPKQDKLFSSLAMLVGMCERKDRGRVACCGWEIPGDL